MAPELLAALLLFHCAGAAAAKAPMKGARSAALSSTLSVSATLAESPDFSNTSYAAEYLRKHKPGVVGAVVDAGQRGILKGYDAEMKAAKWAKKTFIKPRPPVPTEKPVMGFEKPGEALWETGGYAVLERSEDHVTQGKWSLRAEFLLPADLGTPTGTAWAAAISLPAPARGPGAELPITDWTPYKSLRFDAWSAATGAVSFQVSIVDVRGFRFNALRSLPAWTATTVEVGLNAPRAERLDLSSVASLTIAAETAANPARPVVYLDNLRFELFPPKITSTVMEGLTLTGTGAAALTRTVTAGTKPRKK